jgi:hypothetical protein
MATKSNAPDGLQEEVAVQSGIISEIDRETRRDILDLQLKLAREMERSERLVYILLRWAYDGYESSPARQRALWELTRHAGRGVAYGSDQYHVAVLTSGRHLEAREPERGGPAPEHAGALVDGTGTGNPPVPPRYEASVAQTLEVLDGLKRVLRKASAPTRPGAMHRGSSGLPATGPRRS